MKAQPAFQRDAHLHPGCVYSGHARGARWLKPKPPAPEPTVDRPPIAVMYSRMSSQDGVDSGLGLAAHEKRMRLAYEVLKEKCPDLVLIDHVYTDEVVSGWKVDFLARPQGREVNKLLKRGDVLILGELQRGFRNIRDQLNTFELWRGRGVRIYLADFGCEVGTWQADMILQVAGIWGEWYPRYISERMKAMYAEKRALGLHIGRPALGQKTVHRRVGGKTIVTLEWDLPLRAVMGRALELREQGHSLAEIADTIEREMASQEKRPMLPAWHPDRRWNRRWVQNAVERERQYRREEEAARQAKIRELQPGVDELSPGGENAD